jgi:hypothetical protein
VQLAWLLAPGLLVAALLRRREVVPSYLVVPVAAVIGCLLGYGAFWIYFAARPAGEVFSYLSLAAGAACVALLVLRRPLRHSLLAPEVLVPLALMYLVSLFYIAATFGCSVTTPVTGSNQFCHLNGITGDNILPLIFADNIHHGDPRALTWGWQGSARPPLQSGVVLLQTPLTQAAGWHITSYQVLATLLQTIWIPALWAVSRVLGLSTPRRAALVTLCVFVGFFFFNSVFAWPKLLAAGLVLTAFVLWFRVPPSPWTYALAGCAAGAGMMAHPGAAFTIGPMAGALLLARYRPGRRLLLVTAAAAILVVAPWTAYQRLYDPPGDQLMRQTLGGVVDDRPLGRTLREQYGETPAATIAHNKLLNATTLVGYPNSDHHLAGPGWSGRARDEEFRYVLFGLGLFNLGWLVLALPAARRRMRRLVDVALLKLMFVLVGCTVLIWALALFGPPLSKPIIHHGSYATLMLLIAALGALVTTLPRRLVGLVVGVQVGYFATVWLALVWSGPVRHPSYLGLSVLAAIAVLGWLAITATRVDTGPDDEPTWMLRARRQAGPEPAMAAAADRSPSERG